MNVYWVNIIMDCFVYLVKIIRGNVLSDKIGGIEVCDLNLRF